MAKNGGDNQVAAAGAVLAPLSVIVTDANNSPVAGITIGWAAVGGGSVSAPTSLSDVNGIATITRTLGPNAGGQSTTATKAGLTGSPLTFNAVSQIQGATQMSLSAGNSQTDTVLATLGTSLAVLVRDQNNAPVQNVTVNWSATGGGVSSPTSQTNASGIASVNYTLGGTAGANTATATVTGLQNSPVGFTLTADAGVAAVMTLNGGNSQKGGVGTALPNQHTVLVKDGHNNVKTGVVVTWVAGDGGGSVSNPAPLTSAGGIAGVTRTLGPNPGVHTDTAKIGVITPVVFADTAVRIPTQIAKNAGDTPPQVAAAGDSLLQRLSVIVQDASNNPVQDVTVSWAVSSGGGSVNPGSSITNASGIADTKLTVGLNAGTQTVAAVALGPTGSPLLGSPLTFSAIAQVQGATQMALNAGNAQTDTVLATLGTNLSVIVKDQNNAVVQGVTVNWAATGGGVSAPTSISDAGGIASIGYTLGATAGAQTATATVTGLQGSPVGFTMTATAGVAATIALNGGDNQSGTVSTILPILHTVIVKDSHNNPVFGAVVTWVLGDGGGNISTTTPPPTDLTGTTGITRTLGGVAGVNTDTAKAAGLTGSPVVFTATANAPTGAAVAVGGVGNVFTPQILNIANNTEVTWTWAGDLHTLTWDSGPATLPANTPTQVTGFVFMFTFTTPGTYNYHCSNHIGMTGQVVVN